MPPPAITLAAASAISSWPGLGSKPGSARASGPSGRKIRSTAATSPADPGCCGRSGTSFGPACDAPERASVARRGFVREGGGKPAVAGVESHDLVDPALVPPTLERRGQERANDL